MAMKRIKARPRTAEEQAEEQAAREAFRDRPDVGTLIERGEIDPASITTAAAEGALWQALAELKGARQARGLSLGDIARRSGIDLAALSRLEGGKNANPTFETLSRYAAALGLEIRLSLIEAGAARAEHATR